MTAATDPTDIVTAAVRADADAIGRRFADAQPFPHVVVDDFLEAGFVEALLAQFPPFERGNAVGDDGRVGGKSTFERIRKLGDAYERLDRAIQSPAFLALVGRLTGIDALIYDPFYLGGGTHENRDGVSLDAHVDFNYHPSERWHRRLNLIVYLNREWESSWGGALELYRDPAANPRPDRVVVPAFNRCVIFETSERSWHGFDRIRLPSARAHLTRRSIALYFYTRERPSDEIAGRHSTIYVQRPLPEHLVAGHVLTDADVAELTTLIATRDDHIRAQYAENARLLQAQDRGFGGKVLYLLKRAYVRFRR
jgi:hypothetical protein